MRLITHLSFNGECRIAFERYAAALGGQITLMLPYGASPLAPGPVGLEDKIVHATLTVADQWLTGADVAPDQYRKPQGFAVQLNVETADEADRVFEALAESGFVHLPLQPTFWAERYGMVTDRFGIPWEINCGTTTEDRNA